MKKRQLWTRILTGLTLALGAMATFNQPSNAGSNRYFCAVLNGTPRTYVRTLRGNIAMISWVEDFSGKYPPLSRCIEVSRRFDHFNSTRQLQYIGTGEVNNQPVLCAVRSQIGRCSSENLLVTLTPDRDRHETVQRMLNLYELVRTGETVLLNGGDRKLSTYVNGESYIDMQQLLEIAPVSDRQVTPVE